MPPPTPPAFISPGSLTPSTSPTSLGISQIPQTRRSRKITALFDHPSPHTCVYALIYMQTHTRTYTYLYTCVSSTAVYTHTHTLTHTHMHTRIFFQMCLRMRCIYPPKCLCIQMYLRRQEPGRKKKFSTLQHIATHHRATHPVRTCLRTRQLGRRHKLLNAVPLLEVSSAALAIRIAHHHHALLHSSQCVRMSCNKIYDKICVISKNVVKGNMWYQYICGMLRITM